MGNFKSRGRRWSRRALASAGVCVVGVIAALALVDGTPHGTSRTVVIEGVDPQSHGRFDTLVVSSPNKLGEMARRFGVDGTVLSPHRHRASDSVMDAPDIVQASHDAWAAAVSYLGGDPLGAAHGGQAYLQVRDGTGYDDRGRPETSVFSGDRIVAVDGESVDVALSSQWLAISPGGRLSVRTGSTHEFTVVNGGRTRQVSVAGDNLAATPGPRVALRRPGGRTSYVRVDYHIGFAGTQRQVHLPQGVSGASGGLSYALALLDSLTPGSLTGGRHVAATGEMSPDGSVGTISHIRYKVEAAIESGADVLVVAASVSDAARLWAQGRIVVVAAESLDEAVTWLCDTGATDEACKGRVTPGS